jgi:MFS family permease
MEFTLFAIATIMMALSVLPLALTRQQQPAPVALVRFRPLALYRASPVGLVGVFASGLANGAYWSLGAVAAVGHGLSPSDAALFLTIATAAGALGQWPVGRLSDRIDRRLVLAGLLASAAVFGLLLAFLPLPGRGWFILAIFFGFSIAPTYSIAAAHAYDHAAPGSMVEAAAGLFVASAVGSIIGPLVASVLMTHLGPATLFLYTAVVHAALLGYIAYRLRMRAAPGTDAKTEFKRGAAVPGGGAIAPEPLDPAHPDVATPATGEAHATP